MPSAFESVLSGSQHLGKNIGMEFVTKIGQIILRARTGQQHPANLFDNALNAWKNGSPIHIHIYRKQDGTLLECWSISSESCERKLNERNKLDTTQLVLLLQSIYSQIRFLPLHSIISTNIISKEHLSYDIIAYSSACSNECFPSGLNLANNQFNSALTSCGKLNVCVVYNKEELENVTASEYETLVNSDVKNLENPQASQHIAPSAEISDNFDPENQIPQECQHIPQLKRKSSALDGSQEHISKCLHHTTFQKLAILKEEKESFTKVDEIIQEDTQKHDEWTTINNNIDTPPMRLSRPVSIPAASPIGDSPHHTFTHPFAESHSSIHQVENRRLDVNQPVAIVAVDPALKPYNYHINLTPPSPSPLSPFKHTAPRGSPMFQHSIMGTMMPPRYGGRRSSLSCLNPSELFGSLVGSYEESILSGRMSTLPSKPINFAVQIGVLGKGKCKPSLKCPPHLNMDFPAYFYQHGNSDSPSPYVGTVDFESGELKNVVDKRFPNGYRIPPKGQLQVIVKNPNKTAVKFFLIPYDFSDMPENSKTFLRQKSYSVSDSSSENRTLRYAIHLQFCSPSKKRIYLYKNIRVVFSHRVPDGSERLKVVCEGPGEPKYIPALNLTPMKEPIMNLMEPSIASPPMDVNGNILTPFSATEAFARREFRRSSITSTISESLLKIKLSEENLREDHSSKVLVEQKESSENSEHVMSQRDGEFVPVSSLKILPK